ncbi:hypothetical protein BDZ97DRAFT_610129 [Flammula alnicola]|nr:hypothetical protein BDZ97DRAFT_610129 [Flammula alnicola]
MLCSCVFPALALKVVLQCCRPTVAFIMRYIDKKRFPLLTPLNFSRQAVVTRVSPSTYLTPSTIPLSDRIFSILNWQLQESYLSSRIKERQGAGEHVGSDLIKAPEMRTGENPFYLYSILLRQETSAILSLSITTRSPPQI